MYPAFSWCLHSAWKAPAVNSAVGESAADPPAARVVSRPSVGRLCPALPFPQLETGRPRSVWPSRCHSKDSHLLSAGWPSSPSVPTWLSLGLCCLCPDASHKDTSHVGLRHDLPFLQLPL